MKIAILGSAAPTNMFAPFHDKEWEIWACSPANMEAQLPRVDVWFEIHDMDRLFRDLNYGPYMLYLRSLPFVYMLEKHPKFPNSHRFPVETIKDSFCRDFFTSSLAIMFAHALNQNPTHIGIFGVDMSNDSEYAYQRTGMKYFIDLARQRGIEVVVPKESDLLQVGPPYGFREANPTWVKLNLRRNSFATDIDRLTKKIAELSQELTAAVAAKDMLDYVIEHHVKIWD